MFTDPMAGSQCMVVGKIVTEKWQAGEYETDKQDRSRVIVAAGLVMRLGRRVWRTARGVRFPSNAAGSEHSVHDTALTDH